MKWHLLWFLDSIDWTATVLAGCVVYALAALWFKNHSWDPMQRTVPSDFHGEPEEEDEEEEYE